jgi:4-hydroxy-3-methylbut-2-enyl diphosphate reductase
MTVEIDERSGFCFGVRNAVEIAEEALKNGETVYSLGQIVHNDLEVERLYSIGLRPVSNEEFAKLRNCRVLIRAHGEPPETYRIAARNNIDIIEATCPIVSKIQERMRKTWEQCLESGEQMVLFGKEGHAEVIGLLGQTGNQAVLTDGFKNLENLDYTKEIHLYSQTTMKIADYNSLADKIRERMKAAGVDDPDTHLHVNRTICSQVSHREPGLKKFASRHDVIVFVGGKESSNGKMLYAVCKNVNSNSYFVSSPDELKKEWFEGKKSAGVCGATSTPKWLIDKTKETILRL